MDIIVKRVGKKGRGIFANRDFKKGELILNIIHKKIISYKQADKLSNYYNNHMSYVGNNKYAIMYSPEKYVNHSCDPNAYFKHINTKNEKIIAMKPIKKGKEIVVDYTIDANDNWWMHCKCGSKNCRGLVTGKFEKLDRNLQKKYLKYAPPWNKKKFKN